MNVIGWISKLKYFAMFGILFLCGVGLPIPEEVTLVASGLLVGWDEANFFIASGACVLGILAGDCIIFGLGYRLGRGFLESRPMRLLLPIRRQRKVARFFVKHGTKAVFFARFFAGVRIGVYAYAGSQKMRWSRFILLDLLGALISGPISVFLGAVVARKLVTDRDEAARKALNLVNHFGHWIILAIVLGVGALVALHFVRKRRDLRPASASAGTPGAIPAHAANGTAAAAPRVERTRESGTLEAEDSLEPECNLTKSTPRE